MTTHFNQSIKLFKKIFSIDWPLQKVGRRKKSEKIALIGIRTPDLENVESELAQYAELQHTLDTQSNHTVAENREGALWQPIASHSVPMGVH